MAVIIALYFLLSFIVHPAAAGNSTAGGRHRHCSPTLSTIPPLPDTSSCADNCYLIDCAAGRYPVLSVGGLSFNVLAVGAGSFHVGLLGARDRDGDWRNLTSGDLCRSLLPASPIDLSRSEFFFSDSTCTRLFGVPPTCDGAAGDAGEYCNRWQSGVLRNPGLLLDSCRNRSDLRSSSQHRCSENASAVGLAQFLRFRMQLKWPKKELFPYLSNCEKCNHCNSTGVDQLLLCFMIKEKTERPAAVVVTIFAAGASVILLAAGVVAIWKWKGLRSFLFHSHLSEEDPANLFLHRHHSSSSPLPPAFTFEELEASTDKFDPRRKLGDGGFGAVYLGHLRDGRAVAVKKLHRRHAAKTFSNEVFILSSIDHPNLLRLHGYCCDRRGLLLVYDYVPNGTLGDHLHGCKSSLPWAVRVDAALQVAAAIEYLHHSLSPAVVHRDITTSNIFVEKDMAVRVGDFGLSRLLVFTESSPTCVWTGPQGTPGYLDPDYHRSFQLTEKSDVYSFGVVLMELVTGLRAVDFSREKREVALADLVVGKILGGKLEEVVDAAVRAEAGANVMATVRAVAELAFRCVAGEKDDRPDAREMVAELRRIRAQLRGR